VDVVTPPGDSTLVSFRPDRDPLELVASLTEQGVLVRSSLDAILVRLVRLVDERRRPAPL
jgi:hypothetical protein